jgi:hypothetical protein
LVDGPQELSGPVADLVLALPAPAAASRTVAGASPRRRQPVVEAPGRAAPLPVAAIEIVFTGHDRRVTVAPYERGWTVAGQLEDDMEWLFQ